MVNTIFLQGETQTYTAENNATWARLYARMLPQWKRYANPRYLEGIECLAFDPCRIPQLEEVNRFLCPRTGFRARGVGGYVPAFEFFDCLKNREFPTTVTMRHPDQLDYLPEPDIFHDIVGHVPMHTDKAFAATLVRFGECAHTAAERDPRVIASVIRAMARFFWFTVEFGLMESPEGLKAYGSGLLSSHGELAYSLTSAEVQRFPMQLEWVINQGFAIDHYQPLLFSVGGFEQLYELVGVLEKWMREGRLDHVSGGEPAVNERDLESFLRSSSGDRQN